MAIKYSKAPISEISFGVFFKTNSLLRNAIIFNVLIELNKNYPILQTMPSQLHEEMQNGNISVTQDTNTTGFSTYLLSSSDFIYRVDLNQISVHVTWQRRDDMPQASQYPGFKNIYERFTTVLQTINGIALTIGLDLSNEIRLYSLKYADRVSLNAYFDVGLTLNNIIKLFPPYISKDENVFYSNNYLSKYSIELPYLDGYSIININTPTYPNGQLLLLDNRIKGYNSEMDYWFEEAHKSQLSFFENIFTEQILNEWK